ncbi:hypothetical protein ACLB2K_025363 [Fragaria x ananassa]
MVKQRLGVLLARILLAIHQGWKNVEFESDCVVLVAALNQQEEDNYEVSDAVPELPFEIITEILSWLPVDALLRFKCVCKTWRSLLLESRLQVHCATYGSGQSSAAFLSRKMPT